jgi:hypothetical protein
MGLGDGLRFVTRPGSAAASWSSGASGVYSFSSRRLGT